MKKSISGIRGIFGEDLTLTEIIEFTNNFSHLIKSKKCVIARDTRPSGSIIQEVASATLMQNGIDVYALDIAPTPVAFREARKYGAGLIISSSHNPLQWNGLKFIIEGRGVNQDELNTIVSKQEIQKIEQGQQNQILANYTQDALKHIGKISSTPNIIIDLGGSAAASVAPKLLEKLGCTVKTINESITTTTRGPDPTSDNLDDLVNMSPDYDIGFAFDLDGDRLVLVKDGVKQTPDVTLGLGVAGCIQSGFKKFVFSIDTSISIEKFVKEKGGNVTRSKVGEANVIQTILETKSQAGGEGSSGGFILPEFNYCRDGILTSGLIASMLDTKEFKEILEFMSGYHQIRDKISIESSLHDKILEETTLELETKFSKIITIDGIKAIIDEDSWVLIRKSNTEDIIRVSGESNDLEKAKVIVDTAKQIVKQCYEKIK